MIIKWYLFISQNNMFLKQQISQQYFSASLSAQLNGPSFDL
jgi:hypothetical protein